MEIMAFFLTKLRNVTRHHNLKEEEVVLPEVEIGEDNNVIELFWESQNSKQKKWVNYIYHLFAMYCR